MPKPKQPATTPGRHTLSEQLREIIQSRGLTAYEIAQAIGTSASVVSRFLARERSITMDTADRIAAYLGVRLVEVARRGRARESRPN